MVLPFRFFAGGPLGSGGQYLSWIHRDDWTAMVSWALTAEAISGPLNVTAPHPVTNLEFARTLGRVLRRPALIPTPAFALSRRAWRDGRGGRTGPAGAAGEGARAWVRLTHPELEWAVAIDPGRDALVLEVPELRPGPAPLLPRSFRLPERPNGPALTALAHADRAAEPTPIDTRRPTDGRSAFQPSHAVRQLQRRLAALSRLVAPKLTTEADADRGTRECR